MSLSCLLISFPYFLVSCVTDLFYFPWQFNAEVTRCKVWQAPQLCKGTCRKAATGHWLQKKEGPWKWGWWIQNHQQRRWWSQGKGDRQHCRGEGGPSTRLLDAGYNVGNTGEDKLTLLQMAGGPECTKYGRLKEHVFYYCIKEQKDKQIAGWGEQEKQPDAV